MQKSRNNKLDNLKLKFNFSRNNEVNEKSDNKGFDRQAFK